MCRATISCCIPKRLGAPVVPLVRIWISGGTGPRDASLRDSSKPETAAAFRPLRAIAAAPLARSTSSTSGENTSLAATTTAGSSRSSSRAMPAAD
jgi:hypothetical protein